MHRVGFIGLGLMGSPMAANIVKAGYPLTIYNRSVEKGRPLQELGAELVANPQEVAEKSDVVITMLADADAVTSVLEAENGLLSGAHPGLVLIDMSTIAPDQSRSIAQQVEARGMKMLDAPVGGSTGPAREGKLTIMVGGEKEVFETYRDLLSVLGQDIYYMGPQGSGTTLKMAFNLIVAAQITGLSEAMILLAKGGIDLAQAGEIIADSNIGSNLLRRKSVTMAAGDFSPAFPLKHMHKDLGLMLQTAEHADATLPVTATLHELFTNALELGHADEDFSAIFALLREMAGIQ